VTAQQGPATDRVTTRLLDGGNGPFVGGTAFDLATVGYAQAEYSLRGEVRAFATGDDGLSVAATAEVATRIVVYRPVDLTAFDGTVVVEWLNVSGGVDAAPFWLCAHRELIRRGTAYVGVSAQRLGVNGGDSILGMPVMALVDIDPARYGALDHPGDRFSYDVFAMAAEVGRAGAGTILEGLPIERVLGTGESQSAYRLTTYVNDVDPHEPRFDGFLVHARGGPAAPLDDVVDPRGIREGDPTPFRDGLRVPVLCVEAETDLVTLGYQGARQDDAEHLAVWEVAGASHADVYLLGVGYLDDGLRPIDELAAAWRPSAEVLGSHLAHPINAGPQHYVMDAAVRALDSWVRHGRRPPASPRLHLDGTTGFELDELGNARGGLRTPHVDVPTGALSGLGNAGGPVAFLSGTTRAFTAEQLRALYGDRAGFEARFRESAAATVEAGFFVAEDLEEVVAVAALNLEL
jgi:hypothetical protein